MKKGKSKQESNKCKGILRNERKSITKVKREMSSRKDAEEKAIEIKRRNDSHPSYL